MGASTSRIEEDKAGQLCRERRKFVRQALDGRCSLAVTHVAYIEALKAAGIALRKFIESEALVESSLYTSTSAIPDPLVITDKSVSHFSFSSPSALHVDATEHLSPSPSTTSSRYQTNHMKFGGIFSRKVEEKPSVPVLESVTSSTPIDTTPRSAETAETSPFETTSDPNETTPWDYFGFFNAVDSHLSSHEGREYSQGFENADDKKRHREEEGIPDLEDEEEKVSNNAREDSQASEDEFDEPSTATLVRSFENVNRASDHAATSASDAMPREESVSMETEDFNTEKINSPDLSPLRTTSAGVEPVSEVKTAVIKEVVSEKKAAPKDFLSSMEDIGYLFVKASESGSEVPRMLEANKFHFRPILPGKESSSMSMTLLKACFSCGDDPSQVQEEPPQTSIKYLTWHRTTSFRSSSSRNLLGENSKDNVADLTSNLFDNSCMISGSHASTLDRLYAWEKKLYDEVKASGLIRREYDEKCKFLRQLESKGESSHKIDKVRAVVKDLHSRIRVSIHRIDSISKKIEELRDKELQPQLEELIEGLRKMWEGMYDCHKQQFQIISIAYCDGNTKLSINSDLHRQVIIQLQSDLSALSSSFSKWIGAQKAYVEAIDKWLFKCVSLSQKPSKRKRKMQPPPYRNYGPPIYVTCGDWLEKLGNLPTERVADSIKGLVAEIARLVPQQEKNQWKGLNHWQAGSNGDAGVNTLRDETVDDWITVFDHLQSSLVGFIGKLNNFSESSANMYAELQKATREAKRNYHKSGSDNNALPQEREESGVAASMVDS